MVTAAGSVGSTSAHEWKDKSGHYRVEAELAVASGATDLWNVSMRPKGGYGYPYHVLVHGRNSDEARVAALNRYPNYTVGGIAKHDR